MIPEEVALIARTICNDIHGGDLSDYHDFIPLAWEIYMALEELKRN